MFGAQCNPRTWLRPRATAASGPPGGAAGGRPVSGGGRVGPVARHCGPIQPPGPSQPGSRGGVRVCTNFHRPIPSLARVAPAPTSVPHTWSPKQAVQLGSQEQRRRPVRSKVGWDKAAGAPPPRPWSGVRPCPIPTRLRRQEP